MAIASEKNMEFSDWTSQITWFYMKKKKNRMEIFHNF